MGKNQTRTFRRYTVILTAMKVFISKFFQGPFSIKLLDVRTCKGPKRKDCALNTIRSNGDTNLTFDLVVKENIAPMRVSKKICLNTYSRFVEKDIWCPSQLQKLSVESSTFLRTVNKPPELNKDSSQTNDLEDSIAITRIGKQINKRYSVICDKENDAVHRLS